MPPTVFSVPDPSRLLEVVADYTRLSAVHAAGRAGHWQASGAQYPGVSAGPRLMLCYGPAMSEVETARLLLRRWQDDDLEPLVTLFGDPRVARFLSVDGRPWPRERTVGAFEHFVRQWEEEHGFGPWAAVDKATGRWLGQIGLNELPSWPGPQKVEVGWELHPASTRTRETGILRN